MSVDTALNVGTALARILKIEGTELLFCFPTTEIIEAAAIEGIRIITCRTERTVTNMADGYTRILNGKRIGVCAVQQGAGIENAYVGVAQAYADSTPLLMLPAGPPLNRQGYPDLFDTRRNYRGVTKWLETVTSADRVTELATRAFTKLRNGRRRPVLLEVPRDVVGRKVDEVAFKYSRIETHASAGDPEDVADAMRRLLAAKRPLLYVGQGVLWAEASAELVKFAELLHIPVATTLLGKSAFPEEHPLALGIAGGANCTGPADHYLTTSDVVISIGASHNRTLAAARIPAGKTIIHCTQDIEDLNTEYRTPCAIIGDAKLVLRQLCMEAGRQDRRSADPAAEIKALWDSWLAQWMPKLTSDEIPINPHRIVWDLMKTIDPHTSIVTHDSGTPRAQIATFYRAGGPRSYIGWGNSHQLGSSLGLIMGAKLAAPEKLAVAFMGDAAYGMCGMDLETAVRERIPVLCIVLNNAVMATYPGALQVASERYNVGKISGDYTMISKGLGCYAERIEKPGDIVNALRRGIAATQAGQPAVLEFMTSVEGVGPVPGATAPQ